eukprot:g39632.t1
MSLAGGSEAVAGGEGWWQRGGGRWRGMVAAMQWLVVKNGGSEAVAGGEGWWQRGGGRLGGMVAARRWPVAKDGGSEAVAGGEGWWQQKNWRRGSRGQSLASRGEVWSCPIKVSSGSRQRRQL